LPNFGLSNACTRPGNSALIGEVLPVATIEGGSLQDADQGPEGSEQNRLPAFNLAGSFFAVFGNYCFLSGHFPNRLQFFPGCSNGFMVHPQHGRNLPVALLRRLNQLLPD
jgi:hypothetical protein